MKEHPTLNTIEDLVNVALNQSAYAADKRWELHSRSDWEWVDSQAGDQWRDAEDLMIDHYRELARAKSQETGTRVAYWNLPEYETASEEHRAKKPEQKLVTHWGLDGEGSSYYHLSTELGETLDKVWTKKPSRYNNTPQRTGRLTLTGMLKRLGKTDIKERLTIAHDAEKERQAKGRRDWQRQCVKESMGHLRAAIERANVDNVGQGGLALYDLFAANLNALLGAYETEEKK